MKYSILFAISLALALPLYAGHKKGAAAKAKPTPEQVFNKKDKNQDGFLSEQEFVGKSKHAAKHAAKKAKRFAKKDKNHDGKLSQQEFVGKGKHHRKGKHHAAPATPSASQNP